MQAPDVLGAVLERAGLRGQVYCRTEARAPWGLRVPNDGRAMFHVVLTGACFLVVGGESIQVGAGDVLLFPRGAAHALADAPRTPKVELGAWLARGAGALGGDEGPSTEVICGVYGFAGDLVENPVLDRLPDRIHLRAASAELSGTLTSLRMECDRGDRASALVLGRLLDVLFVQIVRAWVESAPVAEAGWLAALDDAALGRALAAIHAEPARDLTVDELARLAGTSRATLARRFVAELGEPPMAYAARVRLRGAAQRLARGGDVTLATVAAEAGYANEFVFSRAFRRQFGEPPGRYRDRHQA